jgi:hypothetical protein
MWDCLGGDAGIEWAAKKLQSIDKEKLAEGVIHYLKDGTIWTGATHKDSTGRLMTGATHNKDSQYLYHKEDLAEKHPKDN